MTLRNAKCTRRRCGMLLLTIFLLLVVRGSFAAAEEKWSGIDDSVVKKYAKQYGREAREPLINTDQGDLLLFVFLFAGAVGGFAAGYFWRKLIERKPGKIGRETLEK